MTSKPRTVRTTEAVQDRPAPAIWLLGALVILLGAILALPQPSQAANGRAPIGKAVLSPEDAARYKQIFALQEDGKWQQADALIAQLSDRVLMGHVQFQRYMHPTDYRSKGSELAAWLKAYGDHPGAERIHKLAQRRTSGGVAAPRGNFLTGIGEGGTGVGWGLESSSSATAKSVWRKFRRALNRGQTLVVKRITQSSDAKRSLSQIDHDRMRGGLAYAYFVDGRDDWAVEWAEKAIAGSGDRVPLAHWAAGLAQFRAGNYAEAASHFEAVSRSGRSSNWLSSGGAFWAARAHTRAGSFTKVSALLQKAAAHPRTFYGMLGLRAAGQFAPFNWQNGDATSAVTRVAGTPAGKRALALAEIGKYALASEELRGLATVPDAGMKRAVALAAEARGMPEVALRLAARDRSMGDPGLYPMPHWAPQGGWRLDQALVWAFARQESGLDPEAISHAGARGLMQLMPKTAVHVAGDRSLAQKSGRDRLFDPTFNLRLGQSYIAELLSMGHIRGNLLYAVAGYNAGPGRLMDWQSVDRHKNDPLLFVEAMSSRETRNFVERVMCNYWIYRDRMGQSTPTLDALVSGSWPIYDLRSGPRVQTSATR